jgi:DNA processing protein
MPIEWEPRGRDFPRRNRIVSGLALATVVVEAARGSGSLITARFAAEQNREVFAAPGSPLDPRAEGTNDLLREGAAICARVEDVLAIVDPLRARDPFADFREDTADASEPLGGEQPLLGVDPDAIPRTKAGQELDEPVPTYDSGGEGALGQIEALLGPSPISIDDLSRVAEVDVRHVRMAIVELDLAGRIEHSGGDRVALLPLSEIREPR